MAYGREMCRDGRLLKAAELVGRWERTKKDVVGKERGGFDGHSCRLNQRPQKFLRAVKQVRGKNLLQTVIGPSTGEKTFEMPVNSRAQWEKHMLDERQNDLEKRRGLCVKKLAFVQLIEVTTWQTHLAGFSTQFWGVKRKFLINFFLLYLRIYASVHFAADVPNSIGNIEMVDQQTEPGQPEIQQEGEQRKEPEADNTCAITYTSICYDTGSCRPLAM
uniref:Uncharacterized protein n=1 Tax=Tetranychus urticae TaxID=32264 RepID=T1K0B5_TETUR